MKSIYMMISVLTATALAQGSITCSFSEATGAQHCYAAEGQLMIFDLPDMENRQMRLIKDKSYLIFDMNKNKTKFNEEYTNNPELFANGSLKLGEATKKHAGDYTLEEYGLNGVLSRKLYVHLEIQAPVSKPAVSQRCLSPEKMNISCSSKGDRVEFVFTLDDRLLMQTGNNSRFLNSRIEKTSSLPGTTRQDKHGVSSVTISLNGQLTGNLLCNVWNHVSREETAVQLESCKGSSSFPAVAVTVTVMVILLAVLFLVARRRGLVFLHNNTTPTAAPEELMDNREDEIHYADVIIIQKMRTTEPNSDHNSTESSVNLPLQSAEDHD